MYVQAKLIDLLKIADSELGWSTSIATVIRRGEYLSFKFNNYIFITKQFNISYLAHVDVCITE